MVRIQHVFNHWIKGTQEWVMMANDHTFVVPANLLCYLQDQHHHHPKDTPLYLGHRLTLDGAATFFNSGMLLVVVVVVVVVVLVDSIMAALVT